jgi:hypothetical protein
LPLPNSDFYQLADVLTPEEKTIVKKVRAYMETNVQPVFNKYCSDDAFPFELLPSFKELQLGGLGFDGYGCAGGSQKLFGFVAMELARVDASMCTSFGVTVVWRWARSSAGCSVAPLSFRLLPVPSPEVRAHRLLALAVRDVRRLAVASQPLEDWESLVCGRLAALLDQAEPLQRSRLLAALSVGTEILHLHRIVPRLGADVDLDAAVEDIARGNSAFAVARMRQLDRCLASSSDSGLESAIGVRDVESYSDHV